MEKYKKIAKQWDKNALGRFKQINSGNDLSFHKILIPGILKALGNVQGLNGIDVGCGPGVMSNILVSKGKVQNIIALDMSKGMINLAKQNNNFKNIIFINSTTEHFAQKKSYHSSFDFGVANMTFNTTPYLSRTIEAISVLLKNNATFVFTVAHPYFWNKYRRLENESSFKYDIEHEIMWNFKISMDKKPLKSKVTYIHRPLTQYSRELFMKGFITDYIEELKPSGKLPKSYLATWKYPRFICWKTRLTK